MENALETSDISVTVVDSEIEYRVNEHVDDVRSDAVVDLAVVKSHVLRPHDITNQQITV